MSNTVTTTVQSYGSKYVVLWVYISSDGSEETHKALLDPATYGWTEANILKVTSQATDFNIAIEGASAADNNYAYPEAIHLTSSSNHEFDYSSFGGVTNPAYGRYGYAGKWTFSTDSTDSGEIATFQITFVKCERSKEKRIYTNFDFYNAAGDTLIGARSMGLEHVGSIYYTGGNFVLNATSEPRFVDVEEGDSSRGILEAYATTKDKQHFLGYGIEGARPNFGQEGWRGSAGNVWDEKEVFDAKLPYQHAHTAQHLGPSLYCDAQWDLEYWTYAPWITQLAWHEYLLNSLNWCAMLDNSKKIIPFLSPRYLSSRFPEINGVYFSATIWEEMINACWDDADGFVIWLPTNVGATKIEDRDFWAPTISFAKSKGLL